MAVWKILVGKIPVEIVLERGVQVESANAKSAGGRSVG